MIDHRIGTDRQQMLVRHFGQFAQACAFAARQNYAAQRHYASLLLFKELPQRVTENTEEKQRKKKGKVIEWYVSIIYLLAFFLCFVSVFSVTRWLALILISARVGGHDDVLHAGETADSLGESHGILAGCTAGEDINGRALHLDTDLLIACLASTQVLNSSGEGDGGRRRMRMGRQACSSPSLLPQMGGGRGETAGAGISGASKVICWLWVVRCLVPSSSILHPPSGDGEPGDAERVCVGRSSGMSTDKRLPPCSEVER